MNYYFRIYICMLVFLIILSLKIIKKFVIEVKTLSLTRNVSVYINVWWETDQTLGGFCICILSSLISLNYLFYEYFMHHGGSHARCCSHQATRGKNVKHRTHTTSHTQQFGCSVCSFLGHKVRKWLWVYFWSTVTLQWLESRPNKWKTV